MKAAGTVDSASGQFWVENPWLFGSMPFNLSCYERNRIYANARDGSCVEVSWVTGADDDGDSRGIVAADLDGNGMPDLVLRQSGGGPVKLFLNRYPARSWLKVSLRGVASNSLGLGARLTAEAGGQKIVREMNASNTFWGQGPVEVLFGLGDAKRIDRLTIRWPSGATQELTDLPVDRHVEIREGIDQALPYASTPPK